MKFEDYLKSESFVQTVCSYGDYGQYRTGALMEDLIEDALTSNVEDVDMRAFYDLDEVSEVVYDYVFDSYHYGPVSGDSLVERVQDVVNDNGGPELFMAAHPEIVKDKSNIIEDNRNSSLQKDEHVREVNDLEL